jgi:hypothetical protein
MAILDLLTIANETYTLAISNEPIAPLVNEALRVIDGALDEYGCASIVIRVTLARILIAGLLAQTKSL